MSQVHVIKTATCTNVLGTPCYYKEWPPALSSAAVGHLHQGPMECSSAYLGCNTWLTELLLSSYQIEVVWPLSSDL